MKKSDTIQDKLIDLGMTVWGADHGKPRIYINHEHISAVFGLEVECYKSGSVKNATLNGEKISNSKAYKLAGGKIYFDLQSATFVGTTMDPII